MIRSTLKSLDKTPTVGLGGAQVSFRFIQGSLAGILGQASKARVLCEVSLDLNILLVKIFQYFQKLKALKLVVMDVYRSLFASCIGFCCYLFFHNNTFFEFHLKQTSVCFT